MRPATILITIYAVALIGTAVGLNLRGRRHLVAGEDGVRTGARGGDTSQPGDGEVVSWASGEVAKLHTGVAIMAALAAAVLPIAVGIQHQAAPDVFVLSAAGLAGFLTLALLVRSAWMNRHRPAIDVRSRSAACDPVPVEGLAPDT